MPERDNLHTVKPAIDDELQREIDAALGGASIDELLEEEAKPADSKPSGPVGDGVRRGRVIAINGDDIFVDVGGRSEGLLTTAQFREGEDPARMPATRSRSSSTASTRRRACFA